MNWQKLKDEFPKAYVEIDALHKKTGKTGEALLDDYLEQKGTTKGGLRFPKLVNIEKHL